MKSHLFSLLLLEATLLFGVASLAAPSFAATDQPSLEPLKLTTPPVIDGALTEFAWSGAPTLSTISFPIIHSKARRFR